MIRIIGIDDSVNSCDCCGKTNLKSTVVVEIDSVIFNYGSVCATRHTKLTGKEIDSEIKKIKIAEEIEYNNRVLKARREYHSTNEWLKLSEKQREATKLGLIGVAYKNFCHEQYNANDKVIKEISSKFDVRPFDI